MAGNRLSFGRGLPRLALCLLATLIVVLGLACGLASREALGSEELPLQVQDSESPYGLWVGNTPVTDANKTDVLKGTENEGKVSFSPASGQTPAKLTLDGADITTGHKVYGGNEGVFFSYGIYYMDSEPLTIAVASDSTVDASKITGVESTAGIFSESSDLTITGAGKLTAEGSYSGEGISGHQKVTIDNGVVDATGGNGGIMSREGVVVITNDSTVEANGGIHGKAVMVGGGAIKASGSWSSISGDSVTISGGKVTAIASEGDGITATSTNDEPGTVTITGGTVSATGSAEGFGIYANRTNDPETPIPGRVTITGGTVCATAGAEGCGITAVSTDTALGNVTIGDGITSVIASGGMQAVDGTVTNAVAGMGWTDAAGTQDKAAIEAKTDGQVLDAYKKVQFPTPVAKVTAPVATNPTYDGNAQALVTAGTAEGGTMQYSLDGTTWSDKVPTGTEAKSYTVWYKIVGDAQHADSEAQSVTSTIAKAASKVTTAPEATNPTYNGKAQALVTAGAAEGGTMGYSLDGKEYSETVPTATEVGEYTVWYMVAGDSNHENSKPDKVTSTIKKSEPAPEPEPSPVDGIVPDARGHVQNVGDVAGKASGKGVKVGTEGQALRLESFSLSLPKDVEGGIEYRGHLQNKGWDAWVEGGRACGTNGHSLRLEAVQVRLTGKLADTHDVWYRAHAQNLGTLGWAKGGQAAGTAGQSLRVESLEVQVLPKGETPEGYEEGKASFIGAATANVHVQDAGWAGARSALEFGTTGQARRLEAVRLSVPGLPVGGGVSYEVHAQDRGWMPAAADGALAGTTGQARRLEAVRVRLTGDAAKEGNFSVWYRVHSQDYGWLGWAHDGAEAGTSGLARRAEAIDVQVLPQGQVPRGYDASRAASVTA